MEAALVEVAWRRRLADGVRHAVIDEEIAGVRGPYELAALAFFGDARRTGDVLARIASKYGGWAPATFKICNAGGHGEYPGDLDALVKDTEQLAERIRGER